jgi:polar amino acid transport system substrate-binding protein
MTRTGIWRLSAIVLIALYAGSVRAEDIRFGVAIEPYPPFEQLDASGKWVGFEIDLMDAICAELKAKCELVETPWDRIIPALEADNFDVIWSSMTITEARAKVIDFTDSYYRLPSVIIGSKSDRVAIDFSNPESVRGKIIGANTYTTQLAFLEKFFGSTTTIQPYTHISELCDALVDGRIDLVMQNALDASSCLESNKEMEIKAEVPWDPTLGPGVGAGLRKSDTKLRDRLNAALKGLRADGTYQRLAQKYFTFDPYGK